MRAATTCDPRDASESTRIVESPRHDPLQSSSLFSESLPKNKTVGQEQELLMSAVEHKIIELCMDPNGTHVIQRFPIPRTRSGHGRVRITSLQRRLLDDTLRR